MTDHTSSPTTDEIDEDIEEALSISEHISTNVKSDSGSDEIFAKIPDLSNTKNDAKLRKLFDFSDDDDKSVGMPLAAAAAGTSKFNIDDTGLDDIGQHFQSEDRRTPDADESSKMGSPHPKELSPLKEDIILINNNKISLRDLHHQTSLDNSTSQNNTTNDISDLAKDDNTESPSKWNISADVRNSISRVQHKIRQWNSWNEEALSSNSSAASITERGIQSLEQTVKYKLHREGLLETPDPKRESTKSPNDSVELDNAVDEIIVGNNSLEYTLDTNEVLSSLGSNIDIHDEQAMDKLLKDDSLPTTPVQPQGLRLPNSPFPVESTSEDENYMENLKERVQSSNNLKENLKIQQKSREDAAADSESDEVESIVVKPMEKVSVESNKEALEDISEESEATIDDDNTPTNDTRQALIERGKELRGILDDQTMKRHSLDAKEPLQQTSFDEPYDSVISLNMLTNMESKIRDLQEIISSKDVCLAALNMQLDTQSRRESLKEAAQRVDSLKDIPASGRSSTSLATLSTEYRTINDDCLGKNFDIQTEIFERDQMIDQLTESLQQQMRSRDQLQHQTDALASEVTQLKKQLLENVDSVRLRHPHWMQESVSGGQRLSEISIELVSETDDGGSERNYQDMDEKSNRNSRERQLDDINVEANDFNTFLVNPSLSNPLEQFLKFLSPDEWRLFNMVQKKFETFLLEELDKARQAHDNELKLCYDRYEQEKLEKTNEIVNLQRMMESVKYTSCELTEVRNELESKHRQEMEDLRTYFEKKCAEMEKQYSEEVFSQHSRLASIEDSSTEDISDQENLPPENLQQQLIQQPQQVSQALKKRKSKEELYTSPIHRKLTPTHIDGQQQQLLLSPQHKQSPTRKYMDSLEKDPELSVDEIKEFYQGKIAELKKRHDEVVEQLKGKLKRFEAKQRDEDFMTNRNENNIIQSTTTVTTPTNNEHREFDEIVAEYDRRLQEQVTLAREDAIAELERQIQALLSETATEDSHWPPELILLREKFTAKSQLEIAQLQIKHEEEMARMKTDFDKQLQRKLKRQTTFDSTRDLDQIISERDNLRELSSTLRWLVGELAKYFSICEKDLNNTLVVELQKYATVVQDYDITNNNPTDELNASTLSTLSTASTKNLRKFSPNVSSLLAIIEDPSLIDFITKTKDPNDRWDLDDCLEKLKSEALNLLGLSEKLYKRDVDNDDDKLSDKADSCEEEDGLKSGKNKKNDACTVKSLDENLFRPDEKLSLTTTSLPLFLSQPIANSELNVQLHELKNRLLKSEDERRCLQRELAEAVGKHDGLVGQLEIVKQQIDTFESHKEIVSEGYGTSLPPNVAANKSQNMTNFMDLQEKARKLLNASPNNTLDNTSTLLQLIEDFCRESDKFIDEEKRDKEDLASQIDAADKQLKATRQFLDSQAAERETERDEFVKEIEKLKLQLREKDKEKSNSERLVKEDEFSNCSVDLSQQILEQIEVMEQQIKDMTGKIHDYEDKKQKMELDLKATVDKIVDLREIISELETQIEAKSVAEHIFNEKIQELQNYVDMQDRTNETLNHEVESLKYEVDGRGYNVANLEAELQKTRPGDEQSLQLEQISDQLKTIESELDRKTKTLELLHTNLCSLSCSSPSEDVSVKHDTPEKKKKKGKGDKIAEEPPQSLPVDEVQRILVKLEKHNRVEEAAIKRIQDLEMQISGVRNSAADLQHERDLLQDRMSEQLLRISSLQNRLDEQRLRAEDLHRQGTSDLNIRVHDLQSEVTNLRETLTSRDNQISNLRSFLENSKKVIDRQEVELATGSHVDRSTHEKLEADLKQKIEDNQRLKEKIKNEMINKLALPDLMETMLAEKNEEIDHLKERLDTREQELAMFKHMGHKEMQQHDDKMSARTLSDIVSISEYDEPEQIRKAVDSQQMGGPFRSIAMPGLDGSSKLFATQTTTDFSSKPFTSDSSFFGSHGASQQQPKQSMPNANFFQDLSVYQKNGNSITPEPVPRQINFSLIESSNSAERRQKKTLLGTTPSAVVHDDQLSKIPEEISTVINAEEIEQLRKIVASRMPSLEAEVESLKLDLDRVTSEKNDRIEEVKLELQEKLKEISTLQVELQAKSKLYDELLIERKSLHEQINEMSLKLIKLDQLEAQLHQKEAHLQQYSEKIQDLDGLMQEKQREIDSLQNMVRQHNKSEEKSLTESEKLKYRMTEEIQTLHQQVESLNKTISHKDELMAKFQKDAQNYELVHHQLTDTKQTLSKKMLEHEKCKIDLEETEQRVANMMCQLHEMDQLRTENLKLRTHQRGENSASPKPFSVDEITEQVEKELNYSAQLDSSILAAIESDDLNSEEELNQIENAKVLLRQSENIDVDMMSLRQRLHDEMMRSQELVQIKEELEQQLQEVLEKFESEQEHTARLQQQLDNERKNTSTIQMDDAQIMEALRMRLESAMQTETNLQKLLEDERHKSEHLSMQLTGIHRTKSFDNYFLMKSPDHSRRFTRSMADFESDTVRRLESEIKLLTSKSEREKEHLEKVLELERERFNNEVADRESYAEKMKKELNRILKEKNDMESDLEQTQERLLLAHQEINSLEGEVHALKEVDSKRVARRGREHIESNQNAVELQELKVRLQVAVQERDKLQETVATLREDLNRGAHRENKLTEALSRDSAASPVPEQFLQRLKEMNQLIVDNASENRQMAETLQLLTEERRALQNRVVDLEGGHSNSGHHRLGGADDLEDRANHLFGKYLRVESFRKSLVHQKRYLMIVLASYQENEAKALAMLNGEKEKSKKKITFRSAALVVIAIERMKYVVKRWHTGKRIGAKAIFSNQIGAPRRSQSATNNLWAQQLQSPPCRDKSIYHSQHFANLSTSNRLLEHHNHFKPLLTPHLLLSGSSSTQDYTRTVTMSDKMNANLKVSNR